MVFSMVLAAAFETVGITMFLPIIEGKGTESKLSGMISSLFGFLNMDYSFRNLLIVIVLLFFARSIFLMLKTGYVGRITSGFLVELRTRTMKKLLEAEYLYFLSKEHGYINNAVTVEFQQTAVALKQFAGVLMSIILSLAYLSITAAIEPKLLAFFLILAGPAFWMIRAINRRTKRYSNLTSRHSARLQSIIIEALRHFRYLKATFSQPSVLKQVYTESRILGRLSFRQAVVKAVSSEAFVPLIILIVVGILYYQVQIAGKGAAETLFVLLLLYRAVTHVIGVHQQYQKFLVNVGSINVYRDLEADLERHAERLEESPECPDFNQPLSFQHVSFSYGGNKEVLHDIDFTIHPKTTVAFVGPSGVGKSTLAALLTGILKPTAGDILLGGISYCKLDQEFIRRHMGYVTQEGAVFNDSIGNNISLWDENIDADKLERASRAAHIKDFIDSCPRGYNELLGDNGLNVSGGQRQRICIARELYKDIRLIIFDEATSFLDSDTERQIQNNIEVMKGEKTIVLIAHRLSTIKMSDTIFVLKDGRIIEHGAYDELYKQKGSEFRKMVDMQGSG